MTSPLFSVVLRTMNRPDFLRGALEGLAAQELRDFETVVVNDGGQDVADVIEPFRESARVQYVNVQPNIGRCAAGNRGIQEARGKYISWHDDDDLYYPNHLSTLAEVLEAGEYQAAYTDAYEIKQTLRDGVYETTSKQVVLSNDFHPMRFFQDCPFHLVTFAHRKSCVERLGGFDETLDVLEDWDLFFRLSQDYTFKHIAVPTAEYRIRDDGSQAITTMREEFANTREQLFGKYFHTMIPSFVQLYFEQTDRMATLEARIQELEQRLSQADAAADSTKDPGDASSSGRGRRGLSSLFRPK